MKEIFAIITFTIIFCAYSESNEQTLKGGFCTLDESAENTLFYCKHPGSDTSTRQEIEPIFVLDVITKLEEAGAEIISSEEFFKRVSQKELLEITKGPTDDVCLHCVEKVYYRTNEFNKLPVNSEITSQLKKLAQGLHQAGVCELPVRSQNFNGINIQNSQDVLHHFLCISNSESVFGTRNIGQGGRGPWGIHPMHNQKAGTKAFVDGRQRTLKKDGVCYPSQAVVRTPAGVEIKESNRYKAMDVIVDNAKCAMTLYKQKNSKGNLKGFTDWGQGKAWGSNRHCSSDTRNRLQFFKHIGALGCCTDSCRARYSE